MRTVYGNHQRFETTYFKKFPGYYVTGDGRLRLARASPQTSDSLWWSQHPCASPDLPLCHLHTMHLVKYQLVTCVLFSKLACVALAVLT